MNAIETKTFESRAKLMVTGEYLVLKGALSLALPLKFGQKLTVAANEGKSMLRWRSMRMEKSWFSATISLPDFTVQETNLPDIAEILCKILLVAKKLNSNFLALPKEYWITSEMDFEPDWGIGSSSSLISNIAYWANCDPFELNRLVFSGSGYDIACARANGPITYQLKEQISVYRKASFNPSFHSQLYFVYLNRKQNSQKSIRTLNLNTITEKDTDAISELTIGMENTQNPETFRLLMERHEVITGKAIGQTPVKKLFFSDFNGSVKSLGAWGGDFVLAASAAPEKYVSNYFASKNLPIIFMYDKIVLMYEPEDRPADLSGQLNATPTNAHE